MRYRWVGMTSEGRVRDHNEDSFWPESPGSGADVVVAVADGMGGHVGGEVASRLAIETATAIGSDPEERARAANLAIIDAIMESPRLAGMGTTLTLALLGSEGTVEVGHVGDSRAYLFRDDELHQITTDHSLVAELLEAGQIEQDEVATHPYRSVITRAIGLDRELEVDVHVLQMRPGDRLLLCTDGLTGMVDDDAIAEILSNGGEPAEKAIALVEAANDAGGIDNITVLLVDADGDEED